MRLTLASRAVVTDALGIQHIQCALRAGKVPVKGVVIGGGNHMETGLLHRIGILVRGVEAIIIVGVTGLFASQRGLQVADEQIRLGKQTLRPGKHRIKVITAAFLLCRLQHRRLDHDIAYKCKFHFIFPLPENIVFLCYL